MITFQKWQKKNSSFLAPFLHLHKYKHFTNQYIPERKLVQENTCLFPYWHLSSIFPNWSMAKASLFRQDWFYYFKYFEGIKEFLIDWIWAFKKTHFKTTTGRKKYLLDISFYKISLLSFTVYRVWRLLYYTTVCCYENIWTNNSGFPRREWSFFSNLGENQHLFCVYPTNKNLTELFETNKEMKKKITASIIDYIGGFS